MRTTTRVTHVASGPAAAGLFASVAVACFDARPPAGVPCDPAAPACPDGQVCIASAGGFACQVEGTPPVIGDGPPVTPRCDPDDPALLVCLSFDAPVLASPLANEGRAPVGANLVNVTRIDRDGGGAARIGATSTIELPPNMVVNEIVEAEASIRLDAPVPDGMRVGVLDSETGSTPGFSMFVFGGANGTYQARCNLAGENLFVDLAIDVGEWVTLACRCEANVVSAFVDGVKRGEAVGCEPAYAADFGLQIGQNSRASAGNPPNEPLIGAIDDVRLKTAR